MYLSHFGLTEPPFRITPHTDFFFAGASRGATLEALAYAITHDEGIIKVSGEVGSGKTMLCRVLMERLPANIETIYLANPSLSREEILHAIADELGLQLGQDRSTRLLKGLQDHLISLFAAGRRVVVLIDEAHAMPAETLEEIRLLSNLETGRHKLLQIVLFGQPELDAILGSASMRQLKERITHSFQLEPMVRSDVEGYIEFRMRAAGYRGPSLFTARAIRLIARASQGLTRRINILADKSLLAAFAANKHAVTEKEARAAIRDSDFYRAPAPQGRKWLLLAAALAVGVATGWSISTQLRTPAAPPTSTPPPPALPESASPPAVAPTGPQRPIPIPEAPKDSATQAPVRPAPSEEPVRQAKPAPAAAEPAPSTASLPEEEANPRLGKLGKERFAATQDWLEQSPANSLSIQLVTFKASDPRKLEAYLTKAAKLVSLEDLHVYSVKIENERHYRVAYGLYPGRSEMQAALSSLPETLRSQGPYARTVGRMQSQNRQ